MGLTTSYSKNETDYLLQNLKDQYSTDAVGILKLFDPKPAPEAVGKYTLVDFGTYNNLVPIIIVNETVPQSTPISTDENHYNAVYWDGVNFTQIKNKYPTYNLGVIQSGFVDSIWHRVTSFFSSTYPNWQGFKIKANKNYKKFVVNAHGSGTININYFLESGYLHKKLATFNVTEGLNVIDIDLFTIDNGYIGVSETTGSILKYGDIGDSNFVAYSADNGSVNATPGRIFEFYAETETDFARLNSPAKDNILYNEILSTENDPVDLFGVNNPGIYTVDGFKVNSTAGYLNLNRYYSLTKRTFICRLSGTATSKIALGTDQNPTAFIVDYAAKEILFNVNNDYQNAPATFLTNGAECIAEIRRDYGTISFKVTNVKTGESAKIIITNDGMGGYGQGNINPDYRLITMLHDYYNIRLLSGSEFTIKQLTVLANVNDNVDLLMMGDSISEPEGYYPAADLSKSWVQLVISEMESRGKVAVTSARGGGNIDHVLLRLPHELPYLRPKRVMLTIGTNGGNTIEKLSKFVEYCKAFNAIPIINNIPCNESGTHILVNQMIEQVRQTYNIGGVKFDIATSVNGDGQTVDNSSMYWEDYGSLQVYHHPNPKGANLMYLRTKIDMPDIY